MVNANVQEGQNILITGIGGGVALIAMQLCVAKGASVYVTSGSQEKIQKAISLGAKGGVNYKDGWYLPPDCSFANPNTKDLS
jgi:NADPH:quinone reductase-like Zn-dependent oxidoreductase